MIVGRDGNGNWSQCRAKPENRGRGRCFHVEHVEASRQKLRELNETDGTGDMPSIPAPVSRKRQTDRFTTGERLVLDEGMVIQTGFVTGSVNSTQEAHFWLKDESEENVAFIHVMMTQEQQKAGEVGLCDIEVRKEARGRGYSKRIIKAVEKMTGRRMTHDGDYTPDGLAAVAPLFHAPEEIEKLRANMFKPMPFVRDWSRSEPIFLP